LLQRINHGLPPEKRDRYQELIAKRQAQTLLPEEHQELLHLTDEAELADAERIAALVELARMRQVSLEELMRDPGLQPPGNG
jgi:hypothetical protein